MPDVGGIPFSPTQVWKVETYHDSAAVSGSLEVRCMPLEYVVDVFNSHYRCCWSRTVLETRMQMLCSGHAGGSEEEVDVDALRATSSSMADCLRSIRESQTATRTIAPKRIRYSNRVPPVVRWSENGDIVHVVSGAVVLRVTPDESLRLQADAATLNYEDEISTDTLERCPARLVERFPLLVAMKPVDACASFLMPNPRDLGQGNERRLTSRPYVMLRQSVVPVLLPNGRRTWEAVYSPFTWIFTPQGNAHFSPRIQRLNKTTTCETPQTEGTPPPSVLRFEMYAAHFGSEDGARAAAKSIAAMEDVRTEVVTRVWRFGINSRSSSATEVMKNAFEHRRQRALHSRPEALKCTLDGRGKRRRTKESQEHNGDVDDGPSDTSRCFLSPESSATLQPIGALTSPELIYERCCAPNDRTLASILPARTSWPLRIGMAVKLRLEGKMWDYFRMEQDSTSTHLSSVSTLDELEMLFTDVGGCAEPHHYL